MLTCWDEACRRVYATVLSRLTDLEDLGVRPMVESRQSWQEVYAVGGHSKMRKLVIDLIGPTKEDLEPLVLAYNQDFPVLVELELHSSM